MGGALATRRRKGYQGRSPWLVGGALVPMKPGEAEFMLCSRDKLDRFNGCTYFRRTSAVSKKSLNAGRDRYRSWATRA
jgi:hypothetical protein